MLLEGSVIRKSTPSHYKLLMLYFPSFKSIVFQHSAFMLKVHKVTRMDVSFQMSNKLHLSKTSFLHTYLIVFDTYFRKADTS